MPLAKTLFLAAVCAASAIARPQEPQKEYTPGRCGFHLHEDRPGYKTTLDTSLDENNIEMVFKDGSGKKFCTFPKTDIHEHPNDYIIRPKGFDKPVVASKLETRDDESLSGWRFDARSSTLRSPRARQAPSW